MIEFKNSRILDICTNLNLSNNLRVWIKAHKILNRFCEEENVILSPESLRKHCKSVQRSLDKKSKSGLRPDKLNAWKQDICLSIDIELDCPAKRLRYG